MARWVRALALAATGHYRRAWSTLESIGKMGQGEVVFWNARVPNSYGAILYDLCLPEQALERDLESLDTAQSSIWRSARRRLFRAV